ncbi:MAG: proton-conducting membrane transporter [Lachnospiraceae bacterium]|jgi:multicomponent Na+:H+ antiporter subunit D|nr:proton-conducting membrane transporter [Lachnospiraceae bacterium]
MEQDFLLLLPVFFPMAAGLLMLLPFWKKAGRGGKRLFVASSLALELVFTILCLTGGERTLVLGQLADSLQICFQVDLLSRIFALLSVSMWLLVGIFAFRYMDHENHEERFFGFYLIVEGALAALSFAGNLISFYLFFEVMTLTSLFLVFHEGTRPAILAGLKYLFYSVAGAFMALFGIFFLSGFGGLGNFMPGGILDGGAVSDQPGLLFASAFFLIVGFGAKAGMFPMHGWLPTAHPEAPAPASAVLSGVITKMGVLGIIRAVYYVIGPDLLRGSWFQTVWIILALITVFMGSMLAYREKLLKKRLAYSTVSQVSYILFGLALMNQTAFMGAMLHVVFHSLVKNVLFLAAGAVIYQTGKTRVSELSAIGKEMPVTIWCFAFASLALIGIPPASGFMSKWYLAQGALASGTGAFTWFGPVVLLASALLTAGYLLPVVIHGFFPGADYNYSALKKQEPSLLMTIPMALMAAGALIFGMFPDVILNAVTAVAGGIF